MRLGAGRLRRKFDDLARKDAIRIVDDVTVGFENLLPGVGAAKMLFRDFRQRVAFPDRVSDLIGRRHILDVAGHDKTFLDIRKIWCLLDLAGRSETFFDA